MSFVDKRLVQMRYSDFDAADFAKDAFFIRWVQNKDQESTWFWEAFLTQNPEKRETIEEAIRIINIIDFRTENMADAEQKVLKEKIRLAIRAESEREPKRRRSFGSDRPIFWKIAASVCLLAVLYYVIVGVIPVRTEGEAIAEVETRTNPKGQKSTMLLPDGTKIWLNADSEISYDAGNFSTGLREVHLNGEAFFDVVSDSTRPFIVHTSHIDIRVVGTSFNVRSYESSATVETILVHGKVLIEAEDELGKSSSYVLVPQEKAVYDKVAKAISIEKVDSEKGTSWRRSQLVFEETSLDEVLLELERWYDVEIDAHGRGSLGCRLTAIINDEKLEDVLELLKITHQIEYEVRGDKVLLKGAICEG